MPAIVCALVAAASFGAYNFFIKVSSGHIHQVLGALVLQLVAAVVGIVALSYFYSAGDRIVMTMKGFQMAVIAGVFVGIAEIASFYAFSKGMNASMGIPIIVAGTVVVGVALGVLFLKESLSLQQIAAIVMIVLSIILLAK